MVARAKAKYIRISPYRVRQVCSLLKRMPARTAQASLQAMNKKGARVLEKVLKSAVANAKNKGYEQESLFISKAVVNCGPTLKRYRAASFGRATMIRRRTSHIIIELDAPDKILTKTKRGK